MCCTWGLEEKVGEAVLQGYALKNVTEFKYLRSTVGSDGELDNEICARIQAGWGKWKEASGVLCDNRIPEKLKGMFFAVVVKPTMLYGSECWPLK